MIEIIVVNNNFMMFDGMLFILTVDVLLGTCYASYCFICVNCANHLNYMQNRATSFDDCSNHTIIVRYLYFELYVWENYLV